MSTTEFKQPLKDWHAWREVDTLTPEQMHPVIQEFLQDHPGIDTGKMRVTGYISEKGGAPALEHPLACSKDNVEMVKRAFKPKAVIVSVYYGMQQVDYPVAL